MYQLRKGLYMVLIKISELQVSLSQTTALNGVHLIQLFRAKTCCAALGS